MKLFIVESPAKIKTISKFLGKEFRIEASIGHVREIPKKGLGIDIHNDYAPEFQLIEGKQANTKKILRLMKSCEEVYFAQDLDREGELIAWHLFDEAKLDPKKAKRVVFNSITKAAVLNAIKNPRDLDQSLIDAGMSRTILDRLIGYKLSPLIWKMFESDVPLSIGRVQTVALKVLVLRDREIESFKKEEFWNIKSEFKEGFTAEIVLPPKKKLLKEEKDSFLKKLKDPKAFIKKIVARVDKRRARAPFTTSTLQQEANSKLKMSVKETMKIAQELYEGVRVKGESKSLITYMRTDAVNLSPEATTKIREFILKTYGERYLPKKAIEYKAKTKNAQEAHEAIRPTYFDLTPEIVKPYLKPEQYKLYRLIWNKSIACQMSAAESDATVVDIDINSIPFRVKGSILRFDGFLKAYDDRDIEDKKKKNGDVTLPPLQENQSLEVEKLIPEKKFTKPPARFTESSLVKYLEKFGIGRPSTYGSLIETLIKRNYAVLTKMKFETTEVGKQVYDWVEANFTSVVDIEFTAKVEDSLDDVAKGISPWKQTVDNFYGPLREKILALQGFVEEDLKDEDKICPECNSPMNIRSGKFGQFLGCSNYPDCNYIKKKKGASSRRVTTGIYCELCKGEYLLRKSVHGKYFGCSNYPKCKQTRNQLTHDELAIFKEHLAKQKNRK
ncbi:MAG: DNA topoisomerase I [Candidatus Cloacimonadota bacterium]|nr:MAG: DNA topoisomerase I [Candidatus Cloacimonadota bacterium]